MIVETGDTEEEASETQHSSCFARATQQKKRSQLSLKENLIRVRNVRNGRKNLLSASIASFNRTTKGALSEAQGRLFSQHTSNDFSQINKYPILDSGHQTFETGGSVDGPKHDNHDLALDKMQSIRIEEEYKIDKDNLSFTPR